MKFATLFTCITTVAAASVPLPTLSPPQAGETVTSYGERFLAFLSTPIMQTIPQSVIATLAPNLGLDLNFDFISPLIDNVPGYHTVFPVKGIPEEKVQWFAEAENRTQDDPVIIYIHGGGYEFGVFPFFIETSRVLYERTGNDRLSILLLDYTISIDGKNPTQLNEFVKVYNQLSKSSDNIWVMGDSAGGSLDLILARHFKYPYDGVAAVNTDNPIKGIVLFSPWVNLHPEKTGTYSSNFGKDILTAKALSGMGELFEPNIEILESPALNPYKDHINWDDVLPDHSKIFVSIGGNEVLRGDIESFVDIANLHDATIFLDEGAIHDAIIFTPKTSPITTAVVEFMKREVV